MAEDKTEPSWKEKATAIVDDVLDLADYAAVVRVLDDGDFSADVLKAAAYKLLYQEKRIVELEAQLKLMEEWNDG